MSQQRALKAAPYPAMRSYLPEEGGARTLSRQFDIQFMLTVLVLVRYLPGPPECEICYSSPKLVAIDGCGHDMCGECASELCRKGNVTPPTCPFCRHMIGGFHFVALS